MRININFLQTGGVPLTNDLMAQIMDAIATYNVLSDLAGNLTILSGCVQTGQNISEGVVVVDGDVLYFEGGTIVPTVYVHTEQITKTFEDQTDKILIEKKTLKFGNGSVNYSWSDFTKLKTLKEIQLLAENSVSQNAFNTLKGRVDLLEMKTAPIINGGIVMIWRKPLSEIPAGWKECTDYRGKTIVGRDPNDTDFSLLGSTGGSKTREILRANLPNFRLNSSALQPYGSNSGNGGFDGGNSYWNYKNVQSEILGDGTALQIMNPHRIVEFIEPNLP